MLDWLPFLLLIGVFIVFSVLMLRSMGRGGKGVSYIDLMARQVDLFERQIAIQEEMRDHMVRQTAALERMAENRGSGE